MLFVSLFSVQEFIACYLLTLLAKCSQKLSENEYFNYKYFLLPVCTQYSTNICLLQLILCTILSNYCVYFVVPMCIHCGIIVCTLQHCIYVHWYHCLCTVVLLCIRVALWYIHCDTIVVLLCIHIGIAVYTLQYYCVYRGVRGCV